MHFGMIVLASHLDTIREFYERRVVGRNSYSCEGYEKMEMICNHSG